MWKKSLFNQIKQWSYDDDYNVIDKIYLYVKDSNEAKYQYLIKKNIKWIVLNPIKIQIFTLNIQILFRMPIKILKSKTQAENVKY